MKRGTRWLAMAGALAGAFVLGRVHAEDGMDAPDDMAAWTELGKPGPEHAELMQNAGTWTVESRMWMQPGADPVASKGRAVLTALFDGRFLRQDYEGDFQGQPFRGIGLTGFNNATREYEDVWTDSISTGLMITKGVATEPGRVWTFSGSCAGPGGKRIKMRSVMRKQGPDQLVVEAFCDMGEGEAKCWEGTYTRAK